jgi:microcin C transport system permease protein
MLLMVPTILGLLLTVTFVVMQFVPGGPVEQMLAEARAGAGSEGATYKAGRDIDKPSSAKN